MASTSSEKAKSRVNTYLPCDLVKLVDDEAVRLGMSRSNVLCLCIDRYFENKRLNDNLNSGINGMLNSNVEFDDLLKAYVRDMNR